MGVRRTDKIAVQHARQFQIVDVIALALGEADVLDPLALAAHAFECGGALFPRGSEVLHSAASWNSTPLILAAAYWIALTMFWEPVQRQLLPGMPTPISASVRGGISFNRRGA